eukprot:m.59358 g.59358  ORF g.59358 m.59358 type:complete len:132 (-) comp11766_c0_seq4:76-471(-)
MGDKSPTCQSHVDSADKAASESTQQVEQDVNCRYKLTLDETEWHQCPFRSNVRTCGRLTYAALIATALKSAPEHELTLPEIYQFLVTHKTMIPNATCRSSHWKVRHAYVYTYTNTRKAQTDTFVLHRHMST